MATLIILLLYCLIQSSFRWQKTGITFLYNYFSDKLIDEDLQYEAALLFKLLKAYDEAFGILESIYLNGTTNNEIIRHYLVTLANNSYHGYSKKYEQLVEAKDRLPQPEWCKLFYEKPSINYRLLDLELFRELFCMTCGCEN